MSSLLEHPDAQVLLEQTGVAPQTASPLPTPHSVAPDRFPATLPPFLLPRRAASPRRHPPPRQALWTRPQNHRTHCHAGPSETTPPPALRRRWPLERRRRPG